MDLKIGTLANRRRNYNLNNWTIVFLNVAIIVFFSLTRELFLTSNNILSILSDTSFSYFAAIGFTMLIIMGELDLSVGAVYGFGGSMMAYFIFSYKMPAGIAITFAMLTAGLVGLAAGLLVVKFRLNSMMVTIGFMMAVRGASSILVNKFAGRQFPVSARAFMNFNVFGIRWTIILMILSAVILEIFLYKSRHLKQLYYIGQNVNTSILYGLNTNQIKVICFIVSAMFSAFGGCLVASRLAHPNVSYGQGLEMSIITAAVLGGASIYGGRGSMVRTMLGILFVFILQKGMVAYRVDSFIQHVVMGAILIVVILIDVRMNQKRN
jgi:ribose transport system permease protein